MRWRPALQYTLDIVREEDTFACGSDSTRQVYLAVTITDAQMCIYNPGRDGRGAMTGHRCYASFLPARDQWR